MQKLKQMGKNCLKVRVAVTVYRTGELKFANAMAVTVIAFADFGGHTFGCDGLCWVFLLIFCCGLLDVTGTDIFLNVDFKQHFLRPRTSRSNRPQLLSCGHSTVRNSTRQRAMAVTVIAFGHWGTHMWL